MSKTGIRPHTWKVQGEVPHSQYRAWVQMRAQANYRKELFLLEFADFQRLWADRWNLKGRGRDDYCLSRDDPLGAWEPSNITCIPRLQHLRRQRLYQSRRQHGTENYQIHT